MNHIQREIMDIVQRHINGTYDDVLTRFSYLGNGANEFIGLTQNPSYIGYEREIMIIYRMLNDGKINRLLLEHSINEIIDLGTGDGKKSKIIMSLLNPKTYTGVDISQEMIEICRTNHSDIAHIHRNYLVSEFSEALRSNNQRALYILLGNTLANYVKMQDLLTLMNNRQSYILLGIENFHNNVDNILTEYRTPENYTLTFKPLEYIGVDRDVGIIDIIFNKELSRIEEWYIFRNDYLACNCLIPENSRILLSITQKPGMEQLKEIIRNTGMHIVNHEKYHNQSLILIR